MVLSNKQKVEVDTFKNILLDPAIRDDPLPNKNSILVQESPTTEIFRTANSSLV